MKKVISLYHKGNAYGEIDAHIDLKQKLVKENETKNEPAINPTHYTANGKECIVEMYEKFGKEAVINFCELNAYKYRYRKDFKGQSEADAKKALWYEKLAVILRNGENIETALEIVRN